MPDGHRGRHPEGDDDAAIDRVPDQLVEHGRAETLRGRLAAGEIVRDLMQSEQPEMIDQESAGPRDHPAKTRQARYRHGDLGIDLRSLDDQRRYESYGPRHVVEVGRGRHNRLVDFGELLLGAATLDADGVVQILVALRHRRIDPEKAAEIDLTVGLDCQALEGDSAHRALRRVSDRHTGIERRNQMLLRIGETV